ncbi:MULTISPECIES: hypothetical protein [Bacillus]|uniref:hypothetical protein n=2 Tax=Bacillus TaxID=1386 RepID=UPI0006170CC0|nr:MULTISPECIES: hypothetical protein [Bacillus]KKB73012.1 hypothetical protein TH62_14320 [Bacillus sp. TH008]
MKRVEKGTCMIIRTHIAAPHYHEKFDIHEEILPQSVRLPERAVCKLLKQRGGPLFLLFLHAINKEVF